MMQFSFFTNLDELIKLEEVQDDNRPIKSTTLHLGTLEGRRNQGINMVKQGIKRMGLNDSIPTLSHIVEWMEAQTITIEGVSDWQPELVDLWIENYLNRASQSA